MKRVKTRPASQSLRYTCRSAKNLFRHRIQTSKYTTYVRKFFIHLRELFILKQASKKTGLLLTRLEYDNKW